MLQKDVVMTLQLRPSIIAVVLFAMSFTLVDSAVAHHPDWENQRVTPRIDFIGPLGNNLKPEYRRRYNRPRYWGGKIAYKIAPSSQEAMSWHRAVHAGAYQEPKKHQRLEQHYFYPKPWQQLRIGPRQTAESMAEAATANVRAEVLAPAMEVMDESMIVEDEVMELPEIKTAPVDDTLLSEPEGVDAPILQAPDR